MSDAQRLVLVGAGFTLVVALLGLVEAWLYAGPELLRTWAGRLPEAAALMVAGTLLAVAALPVLRAHGAVYVVLGAAALALHQVRVPAARRALTLPRAAALLLLGAVGLALFVGLAFGALAGAPAS